MLAAAGLSLLLSHSVLAWGPQGHQQVGAIADRLLDENAARQVHELLGFDLATASTWADCAKDVAHGEQGFEFVADPRYDAACKVFETPEGEAAMVDYVRRNWDNCRKAAGEEDCHKQYHYADVAIQHETYGAYVGTSDHDIVHAIDAALAVLEGGASPEPIRIKDKREALLLLAHLVGDLHQPLHVGAVYLDSDDRPSDPDQGGAKPAATRGGNQIEDGSRNLHAEWDSIDSKHLDPDALVSGARAVAPAPGKPEHWAALWAGDTVQVSHRAFAGIEAYSRSEARRDGDWTARFGDRADYIRNMRAIQQEQLEKAGARLAQLLNAVWPVRP